MTRFCCNKAMVEDTCNSPSCQTKYADAAASRRFKTYEYKLSEPGQGFVASRLTMRGGSSRVRVGALGGLGELLDHAGALELGNVIDEQHAVEVIDFVLQAGRE